MLMTTMANQMTRIGQVPSSWPRMTPDVIAPITMEPKARMVCCQETGLPG